MNKFHIGALVRYIGDFDRTADYHRNHYPHVGDIGEIVDKVEEKDTGHIEYEIRFDSDNSMSWTYCNENEIEPLSPETVITCSGSRGYGKSITNRYMETEIKVDAIHTKIGKLEKKMEEKEMKNEVLELWYTRRLTQISEVYDEKEREFNESIELVVKYNDIVNRFENELKELYESEENVENKYIRDALSSGSMYKYKINHDKLRDEFVEKYISERNEKINELDELKREIDAQLSLSNDSEYQIDVLIRYGVLDKKTKKMVN